MLLPCSPPAPPVRSRSSRPARPASAAPAWAKRPARTGEPADFRTAPPTFPPLPYTPLRLHQAFPPLAPADGQLWLPGHIRHHCGLDEVGIPPSAPDSSPVTLQSPVGSGLACFFL